METQEIASAQEINQTATEPSGETQDTATSIEPAVSQEPAKTGIQSLKDKLGEVAQAAKTKSDKAQGVQPAVVAPAFQPNYKFKALDKEHEIPELLRGVIKDADSEKAVRELVLKAIGMDHIKPKYQETRQKLEEMSGAHNNVMGGIQELRGFVKKDDYDSFFDKLEIPHDKILQWAVKKVQFKGLPPEQQQAIEAQRAAELRNRQLEQQVSGANEQAMARAVEAKDWSLQMVMQRPDISSFAEAYDKAKGKPGSFREVVIRTGEMAYHSRQKDLSAEEAIREAMDLIGPVARSQPAQVSAEQPGTTAAPAQPVVVKNKPSVIPNVQGKSSASPAKKQPISTDDLRNFYKNKYAKT